MRSEPPHIPDATIKQLRDLKPPEKKSLSKEVKCMCDAKLPDSTPTVKYYSGITNYVMRTCDTCAKQVEGMSKIVCLGCKTIKGFVKPHLARTGFEFVGGACYHISKCPRCHPDAVHTDVLEHVQYVRDRGGDSIVDRKTVNSIREAHAKADRDARSLKDVFRPITQNK